MNNPEIGVVVFPGSNCDRDVFHVFKETLGQNARFIWHKDPLPDTVDMVILPGGFSYGDYLRSGAIAGLSPVMEGVVSAAKNGKIVIGICNGFQILCEAGLLPGALSHNNSLKFVCKPQYLRVETTNSLCTRGYKEGEVVNFPIAHGEGNYTASADVIAALESSGRVLFRYSDINGNTDLAANPNGSINNIAGICSKEGNVIGLMPHPERNCSELTGTGEGLKFFTSLLNLHFQEEV